MTDIAVTYAPIAPAHTHAPAETVIENKVDATCGADGSYDEVYYCECGEKLSTKHVVVPATGAHIYDEGVVTKEPTPFETGLKVYTCACGESYVADEVAALGHTEEVVPSKAATCTEDGYIRKFCTVCKKIESEQVLGKTDHSWGDWEIVDAPTYSKPGVERRICANCGIDEERAVDKLVAEVTQLVLSQTEIGMNFRQTDRLFVSVLPEDAAYSAEIVWSSSNEHVATVNEDGEVYAANLGTATITASTADGSVVATCEITVKYSLLQWIIIYILFGWIWYL